MMVATSANAKTAYFAQFSRGHAFEIAYRGGCVMGFVLVSLSLLVLVGLIMLYRAMLIKENAGINEWRLLFEAIAGYGLGGSSVALFCRVGGGIYTKAADVGADLVSKVEFKNLDEDHPKNPACIADNVGDNVGDIAGMGSDLFGSLAESTCAALLVSATSEELILKGAYFYPILITAIGIVICMITAQIAFFTTNSIKVYKDLENTISRQMWISSALLLPAIYVITILCLPEKYSIGQKGTVSFKENVTRIDSMICPISGLVSGLIIGFVTEYYTSMSYRPVDELINGCKQGPAINIILGLALGYMSSVIPTILIAATLYISYQSAGMFGIALGAIGMLSNLPICLAIDGYGPISDNAGGLATMCELRKEARVITDDLDSAGNTTAAIGKGFAIGSACLVAFALYGAFVTRTQLLKLNLNSALIFSGLLFGSMIPYIFSAMTIRAVGKAAEAMVQIIRDIFREANLINEIDSNRIDMKKLEDFDPKANDCFTKCIKISTQHSLIGMIAPGLLVILTPIVIGTLFGPNAVAGYLIGVIISGIQMATSSANTGGAWDNCKKSINNNGIKETTGEKLERELRSLNRAYENCKNHSIENRPNLEKYEELIKEKKIEIENIQNNEDARNNVIITNKIAETEDEKNEKEIQMKNNQRDPSKIFKDCDNQFYDDCKEAAVIGDTIGDPLKDTSGPSINILIKLSSIISVIFGGLFLKTNFFGKNEINVIATRIQKTGGS
jgi:inorganic pyrophosphatase